METERLVQVAKEDNCWHFYQMGEPLPEENTDAYAARLKKDRLNEKSLLQLLSDLGASPWDERFYDLSESVCVLRRMDMPSTIICRNREDILVPPSS